jgi:hypothetical protein
MTLDNDLAVRAVRELTSADVLLDLSNFVVVLAALSCLSSVADGRSELVPRYFDDVWHALMQLWDAGERYRIELMFDILMDLFQYSDEEQVPQLDLRPLLSMLGPMDEAKLVMVIALVSKCSNSQLRPHVKDLVESVWVFKSVTTDNEGEAARGVEFFFFPCVCFVISPFSPLFPTELLLCLEFIEALITSGLSCVSYLLDDERFNAELLSLRQIDRNTWCQCLENAWFKFPAQSERSAHARRLLYVMLDDWKASGERTDPKHTRAVLRTLLEALTAKVNLSERRQSLIATCKLLSTDAAFVEDMHLINSVLTRLEASSSSL